MRISYRWLKNHINTDLSAEKMAAVLTSCGLEVEAMERIESVKGGLRGVVIGEVLTCEKHKDSDHLSVTTVNLGGSEPVQIVCGASNVAAGQKVAVATIGTTMHFNEQSFEIKKAKIRGVVSEGMICAEDELQLGRSHDGIMVLDPSAIPGTPAAEFFGIKDDIAFEIGLTPNRTDATSHIGVARDIVAWFAANDPNSTVRLIWPDVSNFSVSDNQLDINVEVLNQEACPRYSGLSISGLKVEESPAWLKDALHAAGIRPINNVVDITNYVLMETGQPLHAFDASAIKGNTVIVKNMPEGSTFVTLDEVERKLSSEDLMICNAEAPMCIGGVFGGLHSGVSETTKAIFLESACFNPSSIRKTARYHGLHTDASFRFERGSDPEITIYALKRAAVLIEEITGGKVSSEIKDVFPGKALPVSIKLRFEYLNRIVGMIIPRQTIKSILLALEYQIFNESETELHIQVPTCRVDVQREVDVCEDILRIFGYDNVPMSGEIRSSLSISVHPDREQYNSAISSLLCAVGFTEIMNNSLTKSRYTNDVSGFDVSRNVNILNPLSKDLDVMRQSLLFGFLETTSYNINRKNTQIKTFEWGRSYMLNPDTPAHDDVTRRYTENYILSVGASGQQTAESWYLQGKPVDYFYLSSTIQRVISRLGIDLRRVKQEKTQHPAYSDYVELRIKKDCIGFMAKVNMQTLKYFDIRQEVYYAELHWDVLLKYVASIKTVYSEIPRFPEVRRDLALLVDKNISYRVLEDAAYQADNKYLQKVNLFDVYEGDKIAEGKKSYAMSFTLLDNQQTLTDAVIEKVMERITNAIISKTGAVIR